MDFDRIKREIDLEQLTIEVFGYQVVKAKSSVRQRVLAHPASGDILIITKTSEGEPDWYFNPQVSSDKGTVIDLILFRTGHDWKAVKEIVENRRFSVPNFPSERKQKPANLSQQTFQPHFLPLTDTEFLTSRGIHAQTIQAPVFKDRIFNWKARGYVNTAFPIYRGKTIVGAVIRNKTFKGYAPGSKKNEGCWFSSLENLNGRPKQIIITESALDALSFYQLTPSQNSIYLSTGGTLSQQQFNWLQLMIESMRPSLIVCANDRDKAGQMFNVQLLLNLDPAIRSLSPTLSSPSPHTCTLSLTFPTVNRAHAWKDLLTFSLPMLSIESALQALSFNGIFPNSAAQFQHLWHAILTLSHSPERWQLALPHKKDWNEDVLTGG